jgi:L-threonylcarbamoyladenylate synthase
VVLPTETVYGLAVKPGVRSAMDRVFALKGRPKTLNLPVVIGSRRQIPDLGTDFNRPGRLLADRFWPGPLTIVMGFLPDGRRPSWLDGRIEVAVRFPDHDLLREVARAAGPFLLTSANAHGTPPHRVAADVAASLNGPVDLLVDGGTLSSTPSTIVNVRPSPPRIERLGAVSEAEIRRVLGTEEVETLR